MRRVLNFNAGPGMLPEEVMLQAQAEFLDWQGTGMSIMEIGHRSDYFQSVADQSEADLRELMSIPSDYHVFFLPGGATAQFSMIPLNMLGRTNQADYVETGVWSKKAVLEAKRYGDINLAAMLKEDGGIKYIPHQNEWSLNPQAAYLHYTPNETIDGVEFNWIPETQGVPLVADMSSMILSRPVDVTQYGLIYAGAQKNMGQAGITVVIVHQDLIQDPLPNTPTLYSYRTHAEHKSFYNTPPTYSWYFVGLVLSWLKKQGGVDAIYDINQRKAAKLYRCIDERADMFLSRVHPSCRSLMNVTFNLPNESLTDAFIAEAEKEGLVNLRGHRLSGGIRASIYNAMPEWAVDKLVDYMTSFYTTHS